MAGDELDTLPMPEGAAPGHVPHLIAGRYDVVALLGAGAMGSVYEVRDRALDERVALKLMRRDLANVAGLLERFRQEVKLARKVTSPHVARVFDIGEHGHDRFLTMELVEGESLGALLSRTGGLDPEDVVRYGTAMCNGLAAAHAVGVVHCDLKPDNVLLGRDGSIKIADFGIARAHADVGGARGTIAGTPAYMAPEQVTGAGLDARSDLYALGVMLFEMSTGDAPWKGPSVVAVAAARLLRPPPDPRTVRPELPRDLAELVIRCMARAPQDRPQTAREIGEALRRSAAPIAKLSSTRLRVATRAGERARRVAVLPFRAALAQDELIAEGFTDDLIGVLGTARGIRVRARGSVARFATADTDPRVAGRELDVHVVIEGRVERTGDALSVLARIIGVEDGFAIATVRAEGAVTSLLPLADDVGARIARALASDLVSRGARPIDSGAIDLLLRGRRAYQRFTRESVAEAVLALRAASEREPGDPVILAALSMALLRSLVVGAEPDALAEAEATAMEALQRGPMLSDAHLALARVCLSRMDEERAGDELRRAVDLSASNAEAQALLGRLIGEAGLLDAGIERVRGALELDGALVLARIDLARLLSLRGELEIADELLADRDLANSYMQWLARLRTTLWRRDIETARAIVADIPAAARTNAQLLRLARFVEQGMVDRQPTEPRGTARRRAFEAQLAVEMASLAKRPEDALASLEDAAALGLTDLTWIDRCPLLDELRASSRFASARAQVEIRARRLLARLQVV